MAPRVLTVPEIMGILATTVPRLVELTHDVPEQHLYALTEYGWSVNDKLAHLRACHDVLGGNMLRIVRAYSRSSTTPVHEIGRALVRPRRARCPPA